MSMDNVALLRLLFARSPDAMLLLDPHHPTQPWQIVDCNEAACAMNGYTRAELIGQPINLLHPTPGNPEQFAQMLALLRAEPLQQEVLHRHKNGSIFPIEASNALITLDGRELVLGIDRDITARKHAEQAAQQQQTLLEQRVHERTAQLEHAVAELAGAERRSATFADLGRRLNMVTSARAAAQIVAAVADDLLGWDAFLLDLYDPDADRVIAVLDIDIIDGQRTECSHSEPLEPSTLMRRVMHEGATRILASPQEGPLPGSVAFGDSTRPSASLLFAPIRSGATVVGVLSAQSYTPQRYSEADLETLQALADHCGGALERVRAADDLRASQELFRLLFTHSPDAIMLVDPLHPSGRWPIVECNPAACTMNGYERHELIGHSINMLHPSAVPNEAGDVYIVRLRAEGAFVTEGQRRRKDGTVFDIEASNALITLGGRELILGIDRDVSERRQAEARRNALGQQLVQVQKLESLRVLAGGIAHDFNNILQAIMGNAELALLDLPHTHPLRGNIDAITREGRRAATLTQQLLAYAGRGYFELRPLDLNKLLATQQPLLEHAAHPITLRVQIQPNLPTVAGDAEQIRQALLSIVANGAEAIGADGGTIALSTGVRTLDAAFIATTYGAPELSPGDYVALAVADTGSGMDAHTLARAGEPFFSTKFPGRGLGLAAVQGIVRGHGGALHIQSARAQGTTVTLFLPPLAGAAPPGARDTAAVTRGTIRVVDDENAVRTVTARMLQHSGYSVLSAADGLSAVELLRRHGSAIDGVLLDVTMPRMDGAQTMRALQELRPDLRVMMMSGYSEAEALREISGQRPAGFLHKPFTLATLRAALYTLLGE
ncbi:MAG: PAS domain S-box protein [Chloroflexales bacterium]|nr:PAS domain S-box protein [Chloroflexales bacterium]